MRRWWLISGWRLTLIDEIWTFMNCMCRTNQIFHHYTHQSRLITSDFDHQLLFLVVALVCASVGVGGWGGSSTSLAEPTFVGRSTIRLVREMIPLMSSLINKIPNKSCSSRKQRGWKTNTYLWQKGERYKRLGEGAEWHSPSIKEALNSV